MHSSLNPHRSTLAPSFGRLLLVAILALLPAEAWAAALTCLDTGEAVGTLYDTGASCAGVSGFSNLFSGIVCDYQTVLDEVLRKVYCGVQANMRGPLALALVMYIAFYGIQFATGMTDANYKEMIYRMLKLALVWMFATQAEWAINLGYNFFLSAIDLGISVSLKTIMPVGGAGMPAVPGAWTQNVAFHYMDAIVYNAVTGPFSANGAKLAGFIGVLSYIVPPLFMMFVFFTVKTITIFIRALAIYLLSISAIAFMFVVSPIFFSCALFQVTFRFFDDWVRYVISFALQVILVFAGVALWISVMTTLGNFFIQLASIIVPLQEIVQAGTVRVPVNSWGVCPLNSYYNPTFIPAYQCGGGPVIYPTALVHNQAFMYFVTFNLLSLCIVAYAFDALIKQMPQLARQLAGPASVPALGGGGGSILGGVHFPGLGGLDGAGKGGLFSGDDALRDRRRLLERQQREDQQGKATNRYREQMASQVTDRDKA